MRLDPHTKKRLTTAQAKVALLGGTLCPLRDDAGHIGYVMTCGALTQRFQGIGDVELTLARWDSGGLPQATFAQASRQPSTTEGQSCFHRSFLTCRLS